MPFCLPITPMPATNPIARRHATTEAPPKGFARFRRQAERVAKDRKRTSHVVREAYEKLTAHRESVGSLREDLPRLLRLVRAWSSGDYRRIPWKALVTILGAVLYFVNPLDLVPDFIPVLGYVDDAAVVGYVLRVLSDELTRFAVWETETSGQRALSEASR